MYSRMRILAAFASVAIAAGGRAEGVTEGLKTGTPELKSAGALAFGPAGLLFVADPQAAAIFAIATGDTTAPAGEAKAAKTEKLDDQIAALLGTTADQILVNDMKVNPASGQVYFSIARGKGPGAAAVIVRVAADGSKVTEFALKEVPFSKVSIGNASDKNRTASVTSMSFVKNRLLVSGLSNEEWAANLRSIAFPFSEVDKGAGVQIFHGAHGKFETQSPIQTFTAVDIAGQTHLLASYVCTPLVKIPLDQIKSGEKVKGTTVAELGNRNRPLDIITYSKDGKEYALMANSARGVMKVDLTGVDKIEAITSPVKQETAGLSYETIKTLDGTVQLDKSGKDMAVVLRKAGKNLTLEVLPLP